MRYNVAYDPLGTVHNAPITSAPGEEPHPPVLSMLSMHGGHIKRGDRQVRFTENFNADTTISIFYSCLHITFIIINHQSPNWR